MTLNRFRFQPGASTGSNRMLPVVPPHGAVPQNIDEWLSRAARGANPQDADTRNLLFDAYWPRLKRMCFREWSRFCRGTILAREDVEQEAFLVFAAMLVQWPGKGSFSRYLLGLFPWRMRDAVILLLGPREAHLTEPSLAELASTSYDVEQAVVLLEDLAQQFSPLDQKILLMRVRDGFGVREIAAALKVNRRTVQRRMAPMRVKMWGDLIERTGNGDRDT